IANYPPPNEISHRAAFEKKSDTRRISRSTFRRTINESRRALAVGHRNNLAPDWTATQRATFPEASIRVFVRIYQHLKDMLRVYKLLDSPPRSLTIDLHVIGEADDHTRCLPARNSLNLQKRCRLVVRPAERLNAREVRF